MYEYETEKASDEQWSRMEHLLDQFNEDTLDEMNVEEQLEKVIEVIEDGLEKCLNKKKEFEEEMEEEKEEVKSGNFIPKKVRKLMKRKQVLSNRLMSSKNWHKNYKVKLELEEVEEELDENYKLRRQSEEKKAIGKLYSDSKYFYKYANKFSKTRGQLNGFLDKDENIIKDPFKMSEMLRTQYQSVASKPKESFVVHDPDYFFFFTSPDSFSSSSSNLTFPSSSPPTPSPNIARCEDCETERVHCCVEDEDFEENVKDGPSRDDWRRLLLDHIDRIQCPPSSPQDNTRGGNLNNAHCGNQSSKNRQGPNETMTHMEFDWKDISLAIDNIPSGSSPGPDGIPVILLKKTKKPISRILTKILKASLRTGMIPSNLKMSCIIPIHKGGTQGDPSNFRPISLTSHIIKTMERVIRRCIILYLEHFNKLDPRQHGSRSGRSTLSQLLKHQDDIIKALEDEANLDCIYLDFAKAYDKVDHGILLYKLKQIGISGNLGRWIMCFLTDRKQYVMVKGRKSQIFTLISGVPQGSVLGPLLFLIFIGDLSEGVTADTLIYVDDSKVKDIVKTEEDVEKLQENLDKIYLWETTNNMKFNGGKFLVVRYGKNESLKENTIYFTSEMTETILQVESCRDLGITMQDNGTFTFQIEKICKKVRQKSGWILRTFFSRNQKFMRHMWNTLVQPHVDYCSQLWAPGSGTELEKIEGLLRTFTSKIPAVKHLSY